METANRFLGADLGIKLKRPEAQKQGFLQEVFAHFEGNRWT